MDEVNEDGKISLSPVKRTDGDEIDASFFLAINEDVPKKKVKTDNKPKGLKTTPKPIARTPEEWKAIFEFYPTTPDGFMKAFLPHQVEEYKAAMQKYGFIVVKVIEPEQCDATVQDLFMDLNRRAQLIGKQVSPISPTDPATWEKINFPSQTKFLANAPAFTQRAFENRTNPLLYQVFTNLIGRKDLWCSIDNWGMFRATKNLKFPDGTKDRDDWRYNLKLHWDFNPWSLVKLDEEGVPPLYQGLIAIADCPEEVGGFCCVPCSSAFLKTWTSERPVPRDITASIRVPEKDPMHQFIQRVPLRKGEAVIWNSAQAHSNFGNYSDKMRLHQFVRMMPADKQSNDRDRYAPLRIIHKFRDDAFVKFTIEGLPYLSTLGRKLIGLANWSVEDRPKNWKKSMEMQPYTLDSPQTNDETEQEPDY